MDLNTLSVSLAVSGSVIVLNILRDPPPDASWDMVMRSLNMALAIIIACATCLLIAHQLLHEYNQLLEAAIFIVFGFAGIFASILGLGFFSVSYDEWREAKNDQSNQE